MTALIITTLVLTVGPPVRHLGPHPKGTEGFCHIEIAHLHPEAPVSTEAYVATEKGLLFVGEASSSSYRGPRHSYVGPHAVDVAELFGTSVSANAACRKTGVHSHVFAPREGGALERTPSGWAAARKAAGTVATPDSRGVPVVKTEARVDGTTAAVRKSEKQGVATPASDRREIRVGSGVMVSGHLVMVERDDDRRKRGKKEKKPKKHTRKRDREDEDDDEDEEGWEDD